MLEERTGELAAARQALGAALTGHGQLVVVEGGIGAGKSALLAAVAGLGAATGLRVASAHATRLERDFGGAVARQLLLPLVGTAGAPAAERWLSGAAAAAAPLFSDDPAVLAAVSRLRHDPDLTYGLRLLVRRICARRPLLLTVDDLQRADPLSLALLADLVAWRDELPLAVAVAVQYETDVAPVDEIVPAADVVLRPAPLSVPAVADVLRRAGRDPHRAAAVHRASDGNPLVVGSLLGSGGQPPSGCPSPLRERLALALAALAAEARAYVRALVLLPPGADPATVAAVADLDEAQSRYARRCLDRLGLLRPGAVLLRYARIVVEDALSPAELDEFHRRAAVALDAAGHPIAEVADECLAVSGQSPPCAARVLPAAARAALRAHDPRRAVRYLRRALIDCAVDGAERARLLARLAEAELRTDPAAAMRHVGRAARLLPDVRSRAAVLSRLTPIALTGDDELSRLIDAAAHALPGTGPPLPVDRELARRLEARRRFRDLDDGDALRDTLIRWAGYDSRPPMDTEADRELAAVLLYAATLTVRTSATHVGTLAARLLEHLPYRPLLAHTPAPLAVTCALAAGETADVADWLATAAVPAGRRDGGDDLVLVLIGRANLHWLRGNVSECRRDLFRATRLARGAGTTLDPTGAIGLVSTALKVGDRRLLDRVAEVWPDTPATAARPHLRLLAQTLRAALPLGRTPTPAEWDDWDQCVAELDRLGWRNPAMLPVGSWSTRALVAAGRTDRARELMAREYDRATWWGCPVPVGRALRILGRLTDGPAGTDLLAQSADVLAGAGNDAELARTLIEHGARLRGAGRPGAEERIVHGMRLARRAGADRIAGRAAALLGDPGRAGVPLTAAELKVARLSAGGGSNRQIAELLGVTRRAVEKSLTSCYRKLDVPGRAGLAAKLTELFPATGDAPD